MRIYPDLTQDAEFKALGDAGFDGALNDRQYQFLRDKGYTGSLSDMMYWWLYAPELVTNGTFDTDLTGWTDQSESGGSIAWNAAGIALTTGVDGTQEGKAYQTISTTAGKVYRLTATRSGAASRFDVSGINSFGAEIYISPTTTSSIDFVFVATTSTTYLNLRNLTAFNSTAYIDNISVREIR